MESIFLAYTIFIINLDFPFTNWTRDTIHFKNLKGGREYQRIIIFNTLICMLYER